MIDLDVWRTKLKFTVYVYLDQALGRTQNVTQIRHTTSTVALTSLRFFFDGCPLPMEDRNFTFFMGKPEDNFEKYKG